MLFRSYAADKWLAPATRRAAEAAQQAAEWLIWAGLLFAVWQIFNIAAREKQLKEAAAAAPGAPLDSKQVDAAWGLPPEVAKLSATPA